MMDRNPESAVGIAALPPHRPLRRYYASPRHKSAFVRGIFDRTAADYDRIERVMALGSGSWYRRQALLRSGLVRGMRVLDIAAGTGALTRQAIRITGEPRRIVALDPSPGMLAELVKQMCVPVILGTGERLPLADASVDFVSMGYALRHLSDLSSAMREFYRVLRPGGRICLLEITAPPRRLPRLMLRGYFGALVPCLSRLTARHADTPRLWRYYWETIEACVPPERVLQAMRHAGFLDAARHTALGIFSEYVASKPGELCARMSV